MANVFQSQGPQTKSVSIKRASATENTTTSLNFCDTPIVYGFSTKILSTSGSNRYETVIAPNGAIPPTGVTVDPGDTLTINGIVLTASTNPQNSNQFFSGPATSSKFIAESIANCINTNINLAAIASATTFIFLGTWVVRITSKNEGSNFNLNIGANFANNPNVLLAPLVATDANRGQSLQKFNYKIFCDVYVIPETDILSFPTPISLEQRERFLVRLEKNYTNDNKAQFDIANILKTQIRYWVPEPWQIDNGGLVYNTFTRLPKTGVAYRLKYGESFYGGINLTTGNPVDDPDDIQNFYQQYIFVADTEQGYATHGTFKLNNNTPCNTQYWKSENKLEMLSTLPTTYRRARFEQKPWFINTILWKEDVDETYEYFVQYVHQLVDGTELLSEITPILNHTQNGIYTINLSDENLNLPTNKLLKTTFRVRGTNPTGGFKDWTKDYTIFWDTNPDYKDKERIYFRNKFGQLEQFDFDIIQETINTDNETFEFSTSLDAGNTRSRGHISNLRVESQNEITLAASNLDEENYRYLQEFVNSIDHYRVAEVDGFTNIAEEGLNIYPTAEQGTFEGASTGHAIFNSPSCADMSQAITTFQNTTTAYQGARSMGVSSLCETEDDWSGMYLEATSSVTLDTSKIYTLEGYCFIPQNQIRGFGYDTQLNWALEGLADADIIENKPVDLYFDPKGQWLRFFITFKVNSNTTLTPRINFPSILGTSDGDNLIFDSFSLKTSADCVQNQREGFEKWILTSQNWAQDKENDLYSLEITLQESIKNNTLSR